MSNLSSAVRRGEQALGQRLQPGRAGAEQPHEFDSACAVSGLFQRAQILYNIAIKMVFHTPIQ